jgi:hypothetical protein
VGLFIASTSRGVGGVHSISVRWKAGLACEIKRELA